MHQTIFFLFQVYMSKNKQKQAVANSLGPEGFYIHEPNQSISNIINKTNNNQVWVGFFPF